MSQLRFRVIMLQPQTALHFHLERRDSVHQLYTDVFPPRQGCVCVCVSSLLQRADSELPGAWRSHPSHADEATDVDWMGSQTCEPVPAKSCSWVAEWQLEDSNTSRQ